eukprot:1029134-Alexandrium_andersonii.AAC.1
MEVFVWCLRCLSVGASPQSRRGSSWLPSDKARRAGGSLPCFAGLFQVRGDWAFYQQLFSFKGWSSASICWRRLANRSTCPFWDFGAT